MRYFVLISILSLILTITIHKSQFLTHMTNVQNTRFILTLQYGQTDQNQIQASTAEIFWNSDKLGTLTPTSKEPLIFSSSLKVVQGKNKLTIKGGSQNKGIIIDNVKLIRQGTSDNIIENGEFQIKQPNRLKSTNCFVGWIGNPQIAKANELNKKWPQSTVAVIGSDPKQSISQSFRFDREYRLLTSKYFLSFQYAAQSESPLQSAIAKIIWNDQSFNIQPTDYEVHKFKREVTVLKNVNNHLKFVGEGRADGYGLTIDNVKLTALGSAVNLVLNGNFQIPHIKTRVQNLEILPGWSSDNKQITLGLARQFNKRWDKNHGQVLTLDNNQNLIIQQKFNFGQNFKYIPKERPYFVVSFNYAAPEGVEPQEAIGELLYDGEVIAEFSPQNNRVHHLQQKITLKPGQNEFIIRPLKYNTVLIGNFKIIRQGQTENVAANGYFNQPAYKGFIVGWTGEGEVLDSQKANKHWKEARVAKITKGISQTIQLNNDFRVRTNKFILQFQFVPTAKARLNVPLGQVSWNGQVFKIIARHKRINDFKIIVIASRGRNLLTLEGQAIEGEGVTIDNVRFTPYGSSSLAVSNGDFEDPEIKGTKNYKSFYVITDWDGHNIQLGQGQRYSEYWKQKNGQVLSLATSHKTVISKVLSLSQQLSIFDKEPNQFKLTFKYAAEEGKSLSKSGGQIFWNKVLVGDIVPTNYEINSYSVTLKVKHGINHLFMKGAGGIEAYGLMIDNVELYRQSSKANLIQNGHFQLPPSPGWSSIINHAPLLNHHWSKSKVAKIDAVQKLTLSKSFQFDSHFIYKTNKFILKFNYALHKDTTIGQAQATCHWNHYKFNLQPQDKKVYRFQTIVFANQGENVLKFEGEGITIDDVRLIPWGSAVSVLLNGGFEDPQFLNEEFDGVPSGWKCDQIQFTKGYRASTQWPYSADQVITLNQRNQFISQILTLAQDKRVIHSQFSFHQLQLDFAALSQQDFEDCRGKVYWNGRQLAVLSPTSTKINKLIVKLDVISGENTLTIKGFESGIVLGNIDLVRYTLTQNIIENGKFNKECEESKISNWEGDALIAKSQDFTDSWQGAKVAVLKDGHSISQKFTFDGNLRIITKKLIVNFQYSVREGVKFQTAKAKAIWNDKVFNLAPHDYKIHLFNQILEARKGNNFIIFESDGVKRPFGIFSQGFTIDDVWVRSYGSSKNLLFNGGFQQPKIEGFDYGMFTNSVPGWTTKDIYLGVGYFFSKNWGDTQIIQLDGNHQNAKIMQRIKIDQSWHIIQ